MVDVFVSYSSRDRERVRGLVAQIEAIGCSVWWDREIGAGAAFDREIEKAIDEAHCIVVVWTEHSVDSEWVRTEANEGLSKGILVPVAFEVVKPPLAFRRIQTIDLAAPDANASLVSAITKLLPATASSDGLPLVGRARELERITDMVERARKGEGAFALFSGETGIGKTRMTQEAERIARAAGMLVLRGHCSDSDAAPPYQPTIEHIERLRRVLSPEAMRRSMGENATELGKLMPELRQQYSDIPPYPTLPPEQERRYLLHGMAEFIARGAGVQPLMLVFEDLHWADESTCIMLRYLAERLRGEPVLLVGTYRDQDLAPGGPFGRALQDLNRGRLAEQLRLERLAPDHISELLVRRYGSVPPAQLIELVYAETEGNPFFIDEVIRHLHDVGKLLNEAGKFRDGIEIADTEVTRGVRLMIEDRVAQVGPHCREILTLAAVAGRSFPFDLLVKADTKRHEDEILDAIEEAERNRLIEDTSKDRIASYRFVHEQIRQTLLAGLSFPRRQRLHLRIADAIEASHPANPDKYASEIGHHLYHAGPAADHVRAAHYLSLSGERAVDALAFEDALKQFDLALGALGEDGEVASRARLHALRSKALYGAERIPQSLEALTLAVALAPTQDEKDDFTLQRCWMLLDIWRGSESVADLERLLARASASGDAARELAVQRAVARAYYVMSLDHAGFTEKTKAAFERTIDLARGQGSQLVLASTLIATAQLIDYWPDYRDQARANLDEAFMIARELKDEALDCDVATARLGMHENSAMAGEAVIARLVALRDPIRLNALYFRMMWATLGAGRFERCVEICDAGVELAHRIGTLPVQYPTIKAMALMEMGRFDAAWTAVDAEIADESHRFGAALQAMGRMHYEITVGALPAALDRAPHVIAESRVLERMWMLAWISRGLSTAAPLYAGDAATLVRIESLVAAAGRPPGFTGLAALALAKGDLVEARALLAKLQPALNTETMVSDQFTFLSVSAALDRAEGNAGAARESLRAGVKLARETGAVQRLWQLLGQLALAEDALGDGGAAATSRAEARARLASVAETVADPSHRALMTTGPLARFAGLAG